MEFDQREYKLLHEHLTAAAQLPAQSRLTRLVRQPRKMLYPKLLSWLRYTTEVPAHTFWGGSLSVLLPELISIRLWRYGFFEEDVCRYLLHILRPGMTFVDIGAHFGFFTLLASFLVSEQGRVLSFEPTPSTYQQLIKNTGEQKNIEICECAAFDRETRLKLQDFGVEFSAYNSAFGMRQGVEHRPQVNREFSVLARRVDDVLKEKNFDSVQLIKIDAESSEMQVLHGLADTLSRHRPAVIIEVGDFDIEGVPTTEQLIAWMQELTYVPYEINVNGSLQPTTRTRFVHTGKNLLFLADVRG